MTDSNSPEQPILMVDDEPAWLHSLALSLKVSAGINHVIRCHDSRQAFDLLLEHDCRLVLLDLNMPHISGEALLDRIKQERPDVAVIIISGMNQIDTAIRCVKAGAADFFVKTDERERVVAGIMRTLKQQQVLSENRRLTARLLESRVQENPAFAPIITHSDQMRRIFAYLEAVASGQEPVLISGESGTGKELIARALHQLCCPQRPWVAINAAGLDDMVFSDTLFGHTKGAFTGADQQRQGLIDKAADGLLFLDEIGDLPQSSQIKLLRLLQEGEYFPLGSDQPRRARARLVFATNQQLAEKVEQGSFRRDLYYRLCAHLVELPPLRLRPEDLPLLAEHFVAEAARNFAKEPPAIPSELLRLLSGYTFPGNVRELRALFFDALSVHQGEVLALDRFLTTIGTRRKEDDQGKSTRCDRRNDKHQLPASGARAGNDTVIFGADLPTLKEIGKLLVDEALARSGGNQSAAARMLGISPQALNKRLKQNE